MTKFSTLKTQEATCNQKTELSKTERKAKAV